LVLYNHKSWGYHLNYIPDWILGPPCVLACPLQQKVSHKFSYMVLYCIFLSRNCLLIPTFCCTIRDAVACFTGFKDQGHLKELLYIQHRLCNWSICTKKWSLVIANACVTKVFLTVWFKMQGMWCVSYVCFLYLHSSVFRLLFF